MASSGVVKVRSTAAWTLVDRVRSGTGSELHLRWRLGLGLGL